MNTFIQLTPEELAARRAKRELDEYNKHVAMFPEAHVDANGVVRWISNDRVPPSEILEAWGKAGFQFNMGLSVTARKADDAAFFEEYAKAQANRTPEQIAEERAMARAAHGPGVRLTNVLTGESFTT